MSSDLIELKDGQIYTGYDAATAVEVCTPSYYGCSLCISVSASNGYVVITLTLKTPFGNYSKSFKVTKGGTFTWQPFSKIKVEFTIGNFAETKGNFSFDFSLKLCVQVPILGWKCISWSHHFNIPNNALLKSIDELGENEFTNGLILSILEAHDAGCKCH